MTAAATTSAIFGAQLELKPVGKLLSQHFVVPSYQRGYRWTPRQVQDLLDDLADFDRHGAPGVLYCLQPIIVKQRGEKWELIDGQQRLTTIYIILTYIKQKALPTAEAPFALEYETRPGSLEFLQRIEVERARENIDFYYMLEAFACINHWMAGREDQAMAAVELYQVLLKKTGIIWYQLDAAHDPHDIFIRINSGKIALTNAELVKALFLKRRGLDTASESQEFKQRQLEIASEWDYMEAELHRTDFWYFLNPGTNNPDTRIEFVLDSLVGTRPASRPDQYATFREFSDRLATLTTQEVSVEWQRVKNRFLLFQAWFEDRDLYHWIGYLLATGETLEPLVVQAAALPKQAFQQYLLTLIRMSVSRQAVEQLRFSNSRDKRTLHQVLLLFNVETLRQNTEASYRFPFHLYKGNGNRNRVWSLEHIHAQRDPGFSTTDKFHAWLRDIRPFVAEVEHLPLPTIGPAGPTPTQVLADIDRALHRAKLDKDQFELVQMRIFALFGEPELDDITNLALLTTGDNATLGNGPFPQKRASIMAAERRGSFIPIATRNVFLKYYTPNAAHLNYWTEADRQAYLAAIRTTLAEFLPAPVRIIRV